MELTILGSGTAIPSLRRGAPGYLLKVGADLVVIDPGPGTLRRLLETGVTHEQVTHIFCTHNHLDHIGELASWMFASRIPASARHAPLIIAGSAGFMQMLSSLRALYGHWLDAATYTLTLLTMDAAVAAPVASDGWSVQAFAVNHIESSLAYRFTDTGGRVFAFTGDTDVSASLVDLARGADLLLIETSAPDGAKLEGHLTPSEAGEVARQAGSRRVVMTHLNPVCDGVDMLGQLRRVYDGTMGEALMAKDGMRISI